MGIFHIRAELPLIPQDVVLPTWLRDLYNKARILPGPDHDGMPSAFDQASVAGLVLQHLKDRLGKAFVHDWTQSRTPHEIEMVAWFTVSSGVSELCRRLWDDPEQFATPDRRDEWLEVRHNLDGAERFMRDWLKGPNGKDPAASDVIHQALYQIRDLDRVASSHPAWVASPARSQRLLDARERGDDWVRSYPLLDTMTRVYPAHHPSAAEAWAVLYQKA